jgi:hypothetical protein
MTTKNEWSDDVRWIDICRAHLITGTHEATKAGAFKLHALIEKQISAGNVRQTARGLYQFRNALLDDNQDASRDAKRYGFIK